MPNPKKCATGGRSFDSGGKVRVNPGAKRHAPMCASCAGMELAIRKLKRELAEALAPRTDKAAQP